MSPREITWNHDRTQCNFKFDTVERETMGIFWTRGIIHSKFSLFLCATKFPFIGTFFLYFRLYGHVRILILFFTSKLLSLFRLSDLLRP